MKRTISLDVETSKIPYFHPWQSEAFFVSLGITDESGVKKTWVFNHDEVETFDQRTNINEIQKEIDKSYRIVGQNLKFDLNWLRFLGIDFSKQKLYCTKIAEYLIRGQDRIGYSLNDICKRYGLKQKIDRVKLFWEAGYQTSEIPINILNPYLEQDCISTLAVYQRQIPLIKKYGLSNLLAVHNETQRVLSDIEFNGMHADGDAAVGFSIELSEKLSAIESRLQQLFDWDVNLSSNDEMSVALFGGTLKRDGEEEVERILKSGKIKKYTRKCVIKTEMKGAGFKPLPNSETKKEGYYQTSKNIINQLKGRTKVQREILKLLLNRSVTAKALETFTGKDDGGLKGLINKIQSDGCIHPQYNQTVTKTGRLSSKDPEPLGSINRVNSEDTQT